MTILTDNAGYIYLGKPVKIQGNTYWLSDNTISQFPTDLLTATSSFYSRTHNLVTTSSYNLNLLLRWSIQNDATCLIEHRPVYTSTSNLDRIYYHSSSSYRDYSPQSDVLDIGYYTSFYTFHPNGNFFGNFVCAEPSPGTLKGRFTYCGILSSINPHSYYQGNFSNILVYLGCSQYSHTSTGWSSNATGWSHHNHNDPVNGGHKSLLITGDALYSVTCANGETPTGLHVTDWIVFHSHPTYNNPYIGRVQNLLLGYGTGWQYGSIYRISDTSVGAAMDGGSPYYIAVGMFPGSSGRWVLMRIGNFS